SDCLSIYCVDECQHLVERPVRLSIQLYASGSVHPRTRALQRECNLAIELAFSSGQVVFAEAGCRNLFKLFIDCVDGSPCRLRGGADINAMHSGVQVKRLERVNRVGEAELFTNALKQ